MAKLSYLLLLTMMKAWEKIFLILVEKIATVEKVFIQL